MIVKVPVVITALGNSSESTSAPMVYVPTANSGVIGRVICPLSDWFLVTLYLFSSTVKFNLNKYSVSSRPEIPVLSAIKSILLPSASVTVAVKSTSEPSSHSASLIVMCTGV